MNQLLMDHRSCETTLEYMRSDLFEQVRQIKNCPYDKHCELKRRLHTRSGDSVATKLVKDIHSVVSVLDGGEFDELKDIVNPSRNRNQRSQSVSSSVDCNSSSKCHVEIGHLKQPISIMKRDIIALKQKNGEIEVLRTEQMKSIQKSMTEVSQLVRSLSGVVSSAMSETKLGVDRLQSECRDNIVKLNK